MIRNQNSFIADIENVLVVWVEDQTGHNNLLRGCVAWEPARGFAKTTRSWEENPDLRAKSGQHRPDKGKRDPGERGSRTCLFYLKSSLLTRQKLRWGRMGNFFFFFHWKVWLRTCDFWWHVSPWEIFTIWDTDEKLWGTVFWGLQEKPNSFNLFQLQWGK